ncbi:hypothetical protein GCM10010403_10620 [Glycomyces rutgersensis]|uniref:Uncharacterized protein n=1 Tax=Glycomyces rutgersensis TaxID=58115 RepID=A0ABN3F9G5_9ACTN
MHPGRGTGALRAIQREWSHARQIAGKADIAIGTLLRYAANKAELLIMAQNQRFADAPTMPRRRLTGDTIPLEGHGRWRKAHALIIRFLCAPSRLTRVGPEVLWLVGQLMNLLTDEPIRTRPKEARCSMTAHRSIGRSPIRSRPRS